LDITNGSEIMGCKKCAEGVCGCSKDDEEEDGE
jgi:hypothetical protein